MVDGVLRSELRRDMLLRLEGGSHDLRASVQLGFSEHPWTWDTIDVGYSRRK